MAFLHYMAFVVRFRAMREQRTREIEWATQLPQAKEL
jgi:hypothetical protein